MPTPSSGPISLLDIRNELGLSGTISLNDTKVRALLGARNVSQVSMSNAFNKSLKYTFDPNTYTSAYGNGVQSSVLYLSNYFTSDQLPVGYGFRVRFYINEGWCTGNYVDAYFTKGYSGGPVTTAACGSKNMIAYGYYDGGNACYATLYYSGGSTSFPYGRVTMTELELLV